MNARGMYLMVPVTRSVEVHAHKFELAINVKNTIPRLTLICICGNGLVIEVGVNPEISEWRVGLDEVLETAANEQSGRHSDWSSD